MKKINITCLFLIGFLSITSCDEDFLDRQPLDSVSDANVWSDPGLVEAFINDIYGNLWDPFRDSWKVMHQSITDEGMYLRDKGTDVVVKGTLTPENMGTLHQLGQWANYYKQIRNCNLILENIDAMEFSDENYRSRLKGEALFLRAYFYHSLVSHFGGVPLTLNTFGLDEGEDLLIERSSFEACVDQIVKDADEAASLLPGSHSSANMGRATKYAAMALKSRMLLYAASDLYNKPGNTNELVGYTSSSQEERWQKAYQAAKALMDDPGSHQLYTPTDSAAENYARVFLDNHNPEIIFALLHNKELKGTSVDLWNGPNGYHNWGGNIPLENFVSGYQKADGTLFSWDDPEDAASPYENRDPRFYASILYNGAKWRPRPASSAALDPEGIIQTGRKEVWNSATNEIEEVWGVDTRFSPVENWNSSITGYYTRKFLDINVDGQFFRGDQPWIMLRWAEMILNYAEAALELGWETEARTAINQVRERAGMPAIDASVSGAELLERYRYERKYELAFEGNRHFDIRRWLIAEEVLDQDGLGIDILAKLNPDRVTHTYQYEVFVVNPRSFSEKLYFSPIPIGEIQKNNKLEQNPLY